MGKAAPIDAEAASAPEAEAAEPKTVRLYRAQDQFYPDPMTRTEADEILAGYPGEYVEIGTAAPPAV